MVDAERDREHRLRGVRGRHAPVALERDPQPADRRPSGPNPWRADSLEWATTSPPPEYNFAAIPIVASRHPLWDQHPLPTVSDAADDRLGAGLLEGARRRELIVTTGFDAEGEGAHGIPHPTPLPFVVATGLAVFFAGLLVSAAVVLVAGIVLALVALGTWTWQTERQLR